MLYAVAFHLLAAFDLFACPDCQAFYDTIPPEEAGTVWY